MDTTVRRFAARLHNLRMERHLTQEALSARAGLHATYISVLERGRQIPSLLTLEQLAKGLDVDLPALLDFPESGGSRNDRIREELEMICRRLKNCDLAMVRKARKQIEILTGQ